MYQIIFRNILVKHSCNSYQTSKSVQTSKSNKSKFNSHEIVTNFTKIQFAIFAFTETEVKLEWLSMWCLYNHHFPGSVIILI